MSTPLFSDVCAVLDQEVGNELTPQLAAKIAARFMDMVLGRPLDLSQLAPLRSGSYTFQAERVSAAIAELEPLHRAHWHETEDYRRGLKFNPDYEWGLTAEASGEYLLLTMRHEGELVGNFGLTFSTSHHTQTKLAQEDTLFIAPAHRVGRAFLRFIEFGETAAKVFGARELRLTTKLTNKVGEMLPRLGYRHYANQFCKFL